MKKEKAANLSQIKINLYAEKNMEELSEDKLKSMLDNSIYSTFGVIEAYKIKYFLKREVSIGNSPFIQFSIKTLEKYCLIFNIGISLKY
jgi:hypothetical protein